MSPIFARFRPLLFLVLSFHLLVGCNNKITDIPVVDPEFAEYVSAYTSGLVASDGDIQIVLQNDSYMYTGNGKEVGDELFSFSPSISGKSYWKDSRTIVFKPEKQLESGEIYICTFKLSKVCDVKDAKFNSMKFGFKVIPQDYEVEIVGVSASDQQKDVYKLEGYVNTADKADLELIKKMVAVDLDGKTLSTSWHVSDGARRFVFEATGIRCTNEIQKLNIAWEGKPLGVDTQGKKSITIPTKNEFRVLYVSNDKQQQSPTFVVSFNETIAQNQDLTGLIAFSTPTTITYSIEGNQLWVYASSMDGNVRFTVNPGILSTTGKKLQTSFETTVNFGKAKPQLRSVGSGNILPSSQSLIYPFEAIGLKSVTVQVVRIYERNVGQFFQVNNIDGSNELRRVGMPVYKKKIDLQSVGSLNVNRWCRYALDLTKVINSEPGAIYQVSIYFRKNDVAYRNCPEAAELEEPVVQDEGEQNWDNETGYGDYTDYYYGSDYDWQQRDNPCNSAYYSSEKMIAQNLLASDLGIIAKRGKENQLHVAVSNIKDVSSMSGVEVEVYNYQQVLLGKGKTNSDGLATIAYQKGLPFLIIAKWKEQRGYLKIDDGNTLSMSNFDISGSEIQKGIKGYITGERGVWRPGDSLFVTFIVEDRNHAIPKGHPVVFDLQNPKGQLVKRVVQRYDESNMYAFRTATSADAITGNWLGIVKIGGVSFSKNFRIETVKPNRLKISLSASTKRIGDNGRFLGNLNVRWLHGAPAPDLKAVYQATLSKAGAIFRGYEAFNFDDEGLKYTPQTISAFDGRLNNTGDATVSCSLKSGNNLPAVLNANFKGEVFEPGGEFSIDQFTIPYYPYAYYVGMRLPDKDSYWYNTNKDYNISIVSLNNSLRPVTSRVTVEVYKMNSSWWWDRDNESDVSYISQSYSKLISRQVVATPNGRGLYKFRINYPEWGSYYIRMIDANSGHTTGRVVTVYWPYEMGVADNMPEGAALLPIASDLSTVDVGKKCTIRFPGSEGARALISIENGSRVIKQEWVDASKSSNTYMLKTDDRMTPNIYVSIWLVRPHIRKENDLPIRQYGLLKLKVENKATHLEPIISIPAVIKPEQNVSITVSEKNGRPMNYTIAVVDEGLLDITRFKVPNPWSTFYAEEALGVKSWDVYNRVIGAYGGLIEKYFTIGGSEELRSAEQGKAIRFKPVVKFFGPYKLKGGKSTHSFKMPNYVGSVKTMVVASNSDYGYGVAEKVSAVKLNVMAVPTLPRVLGPNESISMPVNVFAMAGNIRNVKVSVKAEGAVKIVGASTQNAMFSREGDKMLMFNLKAISATGRAKITVNAVGGKDVSTQTVELYVREPRSVETRVVDAVLGAGKSWAYRFTPFGVGGTNSTSLELSTLLPINLSSRLGYLVAYPYGCVEQTTSSVFPQLYLGRLMVLDNQTKQNVEKNIKVGIENLLSMQTLDGGFGYWKGASSADAWGTSYAGHFLLEARAAGYSVSESAINRWIGYQVSTSRNWTNRGNSYDDMLQAYRLYTLALAQRPEMGAMNLLKEKQSISPQALWRLAAAYALAGQRQVAMGIIRKLPVKFAAYKNDFYTYGSDTRDLAMVVETLAELNMVNKTAEPVKRLSAKLGGCGWMSTQETAYSLLAISKTRKEIKPGLGVNASVTINGRGQKVSADVSMAQVNFRPMSSNSISVTNNGKQTTFIRLIMQGIPARSLEHGYANNLSLKVRYAGVKGEAVDPVSIIQGTDFFVTVDVTHPGIGDDYKNLTLNQVFPSGWEVQNPRLTGESADVATTFTYQDFRDDRVYTHFDLRSGETKRFILKVKATYAGYFYLPSFRAEAMYDASVSAGAPGLWVKVVAK